MEEKAKEQLIKECEEFKSGSRQANATKTYVRDALISFCGQSEEFSRAVVDNAGKFKEACEAAVKGCGNCISDFDLYRKAAAYYFPGCVIEASMTIYMSKFDRKDQVENGISLNLDDLIFG